MYFLIYSFHRNISFIFVKIVIVHIWTLGRKYVKVCVVEGAGWSLDLTKMAATSCKIRHVRLVLKGTTDMNPSLPVMPPFRQRLFPRQHASEYREAIRK